VEFFEMVLFEIVEKPARSDRVSRNLEVVDVPLPIAADFVNGRHAG